MASTTDPHDAEPPSGEGNDDDDPGFDVDAIDTDGDGSLDTTVLTTVESVDLDGDGINDAALMTSESMTDLDGDGLPDVIETTTTMIHDRGDGELQVVQTTERHFVDHDGDLDGASRLVEDDDRGFGLESGDLGDVAVAPDGEPTDTPGILRGLQHVSVCVDDLDAADHFYIDQLGLRRIARPDLGIGGTWLVAENGLQVHLVELPGSAKAEGNHMAFTVDDLDATTAVLRAKGVEVPEAGDIGAGKQVFLRDPSGNIVELNEPTHLR